MTETRATDELIEKWAHAWAEWKFLADKGDGMPDGVVDALEAAESALYAWWRELQRDD